MSQAPLLVHQLMDYPRSRNGDDNDDERKRRLKLDFLFTFWRIIQEQGVSSTSSTLHTIRMINTDLRISSKTKFCIVTPHVPYTILDLMPAYNLQTINGMICKVLREEKNIWIRICQTLWCQEQTSMIYIRSWIVPYRSSLRDQECPCLNCSDLVDSCSWERKLLICFVTRLESVANCFDGRPTKLLGDAHKLMEMCQMQWLAQLSNRLTSN